MNLIGKTFAAELAAAGLPDIPLGWGDDGNLYGYDRLPYEQRQAVMAVLAAHNPAPGPTAAEVKAEAGRRIVAIMPEHQQRNTLAAGLAAVTQYGQAPAAWPADKKARYDAGMIKWAEIERLRARSDVIEAMQPIPADFRQDIYWAPQ